MAKLITRVRERKLMRKSKEPYYSPWSEWELCEGTKGMTNAVSLCCAQG